MQIQSWGSSGHRRNLYSSLRSQYLPRSPPFQASIASHGCLNRPDSTLVEQLAHLTP